MSKRRARQIVAGAVVAQETTTALGVSAVQVCPWALREGIMLHYLQTSLDDKLALPLYLLARPQPSTHPRRCTPPHHSDEPTR